MSGEVLVALVAHAVTRVRSLVETVAEAPPAKRRKSCQKSELVVWTEQWRRQQEALQKEEQRFKELEEESADFFDKMDANGDGELTHEELKSFMLTKDPAVQLKLGITNWEDFVEDLDIDGDGKISRSEFVTYFARHANLNPERLFGLLFDAIDANGDGILQLEEILNYQWYKNPRIFQALGISNFTDLVNKMDVNKDGQVVRDEFITFMTQSGMNLTLKKAMDTAATWSKNDGFLIRGTNRNSCWDYNAGYCPRGSSCNWTHEKAMAIDQAMVDENFRVCATVATAHDLNLSKQALDELKTLERDEASPMIADVACGGWNANVRDKNFFLIHDARRKRREKACTM